MKDFIRKARSLFIFCFLLSNIQAQDSTHVNLRSQAAQYFSGKDYEKAISLYTELLRLYPKEPEYMYKKGVCCVNLNQDLDEAIRLLRAVAVTGYTPLSWYYLGRACHLYYSFDDAIKAYSRFVLMGKKSEIKAYQVERLIEMAKNGIEYTRSGQSFEVQHIQVIQLNQLPVAGEINGSGKIMRKPKEFCSKTDLRNDYKSWMFLPSFTEINEYVYLSGLEPGKKNGKQLFRIRNINHETWGIPEALTFLNTPYDEEYPFFDAKTSTLYFSSKGYSSIGGYDIFKSTYDWNSKTWSKPTNLGFPINSPFDDYVFVTDVMNHSACFVSNRDVSPKEATVYKIRIQPESAGTRFMSDDEIRKAAKLQITQKEISPEVQPLTHSAMTDTVAVSFTTELRENDYNRLISEALVLQVSADSSARIARDLRILARETPDNDAKKTLVSDILKNEKEAKRVQREADERFASARSIRDTTRTDSLIKPSGSVNNIKVYRYESSSEPAPAVPEKQTSRNALVRADVFSISETPVYSTSNPIPPCEQSPNGLVYRIQLRVLSKSASNESFGGIYPVCYDQISSPPVLKYYAGHFTTLRSVNEALTQVRAHGFPDAFIVAFLNGKVISTEKAREIEFSKQ